MYILEVDDFGKHFEICLNRIMWLWFPQLIIMEHMKWH